MSRLGKSLPPLASLLPFEAAARLESFTRAAAELHLTQAAVEGHGIALGWRRTVEKLLQSGALVRPLEESLALPNALSVYRRQGPTTPEVEALLTLLKSELAP